MTATCPNCGGKLRHGRTVRRLSTITRRRDCPGCGYADRATYTPEVLTKVEKVRTRKNKVRTRTTEAETLPANDTR